MRPAVLFASFHDNDRSVENESFPGLCYSVPEGRCTKHVVLVTNRKRQTEERQWAARMEHSQI